MTYVVLGPAGDVLIVAMIQTIDEIFRACHRLQPSRVRAVRRPMAKALVFASLAGAIALLGMSALQ